MATSDSGLLWIGCSGSRISSGSVQSMEVSVCSSFPPNLRCSTSLVSSLNPSDRLNPAVGVICAKKWKNLRGNGRRRVTIAAIHEASVMSDPASVEITWQIVVGAIAGVTPFVVAGIEFSKRIISQRRCQVCKGSGLILREKDYFKCPECGGFLPWQSWRRFFSG